MLAQTVEFFSRVATFPRIHGRLRHFTRTSRSAEISVIMHLQRSAQEGHGRPRRAMNDIQNIREPEEDFRPHLRPCMGIWTPQSPAKSELSVFDEMIIELMAFCLQVTCYIHRQRRGRAQLRGRARRQFVRHRSV